MGLSPRTAGTKNAARTETEDKRALKETMAMAAAVPKRVEGVGEEEVVGQGQEGWNEAWV